LPTKIPISIDPTPRSPPRNSRSFRWQRNRTCNETCQAEPTRRAHRRSATDAKALFAAHLKGRALTCTDTAVTTESRALREPTLSGLGVTEIREMTATTSRQQVIPTESPSEPGSRPKAMIRDRPRYASVVLRFHGGAVSVEGILDQPRKGVVGVRDLCDTADSRSDSGLSRLRNLGRKPGTGVGHGSTFFPIRKSVTA